MAKALHGYMSNTDPRVVAQLTAENRRLRQRVADLEATVRRIRARRTGVKRALLDQQVVSGIGNIYADEALWLARMHYARSTATLSARRAAEVVTAAGTVMRTALDHGGTSFDALYVNVNGQSGYFDRSLHAYGQEGLPCDRCGTAIRRVAFTNRSSFFCPVCQPVPRVRRAAATGPGTSPS